MKNRIPFRSRHGAVALAASIAASTAAFSQQSLAQEDTIEEVIVTGSRIARDANLTGALPVQSLTAEDISASGEFSLSDVVNDVPALLSSLTQESSVDRGAAGGNRLNLRGLGQNRTLVLVDGRRHVGGAQGSSAVDIGSIPTALVERVEVLTGGASAVYGADAVSGVVNFILRDDFEGLEIDARYAASEYGDSQQGVFSLVYGENFADGRGNITFAADVRQDAGLKVSERADGLYAGSSSNWPNPDLRFQQGEIGSATPNFQRFYRYDTANPDGPKRIHYGLPIPKAADDFIKSYTEEFGEAPSLTAAETALINRAANAFPRSERPLSTFGLTSGYGKIIPGNASNFSGFSATPNGADGMPIDLDGNGVPDCVDSYTGFSSSFASPEFPFGVIGGCWTISEDGTIGPVRDGIIADNVNSFGGDGYNATQEGLDDIVLPDDKISLNLLGHYDLTDTDTAFFEMKYVTQETSAELRPTSFWDILPGLKDNPFLPEFIRSVAEETGGVGLTVDPLHFDSTGTYKRDTWRVVAGLEGEFDNGWEYETSINYGRYDYEFTRFGNVILDRFLAAFDAVTDPNTGQPACRADVYPDAPATKTPFNIPRWNPGYYSYTPGSGDCAPLNLWAGKNGVSQEAIDFVTYDAWNELTLDQFVLSGTVIGDSADWFELPGGPLGFAAGLEYREESSDANVDPWQRGVIPPGSPYPAGTLVSTVEANVKSLPQNGSLVFDPTVIRDNETGEYDATDVFVEVSLPILANQPGFEELTLDVAARASDYSTIGNTESWKVNLIWAPIEDIAFRGGVSQAVRAPNITELFGPVVGTTSRPTDPCDIGTIEGLRKDGSNDKAEASIANCSAEFMRLGINYTDDDGNYNWSDPLTARFSGQTSGNRNLTEETADTVTYGFVFSPSFLPGFSLTLDYWDITIEDAISAVSVQNMVDGCYQSAMPNQEFCDRVDREENAASLQAGGFVFFRQSAINFAKFETDGFDLTASYNFDIGAHGFDISVTGTEVKSNNDFTNPNDLTEIDPALGELYLPELAGNIFLGWTWGDLSVGWQSQYLGEMLLGSPRMEIETYLTQFGPSVLQDETWIHDINARYHVNEQLTVYGGVNNLTHTDPFMSENAYPVTPRGRMIFLGGTYRL
ncbi:MAG: TonB-dependent receptor [Gammaproteobacteria bacterium]|nr:TonB-dependent receptor [Gammaproteobacteria bacterium]